MDFDIGFTQAWFADPEIIAKYISEFGLAIERVAGLEGEVTQSEEKLKSLSPENFEKWLELFYDYSQNKTLLGANEHILCVAQKP